MIIPAAQTINIVVVGTSVLIQVISRGSYARIICLVFVLVKHRNAYEVVVYLLLNCWNFFSSKQWVRMQVIALYDLLSDTCVKFVCEQEKTHSQGTYEETLRNIITIGFCRFISY